MLLGYCRSALYRAGRQAVLNSSLGCTSSCSYVTSPTYDLRRMKLRQGWRGNPENEREIDLGAEHHGNQLHVNWAVQTMNIVPSGDTYYNLHPRGLQMFSKSPIDKTSRASEDIAEKVEKLPVFSLDGSAEGSTSLNLDQFRQLFRQMRKYLSDGTTLFLNDGQLGSSQATRANVRVIGDSARTSHLMSLVLGKIPKRDNAVAHEPEITIYVCDDLVFESAEAAGIPKDTPFIALDYARGNAVVANAHSPVQVRDVLADLYQHSLINKELDYDVLRGHTVGMEDGSSGLLFDLNEEADTAGALAGMDTLYSGNYSVLHDGGVSRVFDGVTSAKAQASRHSMLHKHGKKSSVTSPLSKKGHSSSSPTHFFFSTSGDASMPAVSTVKGADVAQLLTKAGVKSKRVAELAKNGTVYVLNSNGFKEGDKIFDAGTLSSV